MNKESSAEKQQMILHLPPEILGKILLSTSLQTRTMILSSVCKNLNHFIFNHDILWSKLNLNLLKNISNSTIPKIFHYNIPNETKNFIRELFINDVNINKDSLEVILKNCVNLKSIHLRTCKDLNMEIVKDLLEELYGEKTMQEGEAQEEGEKINSQQQSPTPASSTTPDPAPTSSTRCKTAVKKTICNLTTIYWYLDQDWVWWTPPARVSLELMLQRLSNNPKAAVNVPWCDFCNRKKAGFLISCGGNLHEQKWSVFGCFECSDCGRINFRCDDCLKAEKLDDELAISALESLAQTDDNSGGSFDIVEEIINVINEGDNEADVTAVEDDIDDVVVINNHNYH